VERILAVPEGKKVLYRKKLGLEKSRDPVKRGKFYSEAFKNEKGKYAGQTPFQHKKKFRKEIATFAKMWL